MDLPEQSIQRDGVEKSIVVVKKVNQKLTVGLPLEDNQVDITFARGGINEIYGINRLAYQITGEYPEGRELVSGSDWIGPYWMRCLTEPVDGKAFFTGGWHGTDEGNQGQATAETTEVAFLADGQLLPKKSLLDYLLRRQVFNCQIVEIKVTNQINAYNTDYPVLIETIDYRIMPERIEVSVQAKALQPVEIERYYGLQSINGLWDGTITYQYFSGQSDTYSVAKESQSMIKRDNRVNYYYLRSADRQLHLKVGLLPGGLTDYSQVADDQPTCFTLDYGKTYFNLIRHRPLRLKAGQEFEWKGYYQFN